MIRMLLVGYCYGSYFIKSTWPPEIRQRQDAINQASGEQQ
jgi:hypothetical protein